MSVYLPFKSSVTIGDTTVTKIYHDIPEYFINRIIEASTFLSNYDIGPKILNIISDINDKELIITMEKVSIPVWTDDLRKQMIYVIDLMHQHDWAHGDLVKENIGIKEGKLMIFDVDTMFHISISSFDSHVLDYINKGFGKEFTYEEFVKYDYNNSWADIED